MYILILSDGKTEQYPHEIMLNTRSVYITGVGSDMVIVRHTINIQSGPLDWASSVSRA